MSQIKALNKKIRQVEELEAKVASGDVANPTEEQRQKLARKPLLMTELAEVRPGQRGGGIEHRPPLLFWKL